MNQDSAGKFIRPGDRVRFRGHEYTIRGFGEETGHGIEVFFNEELHTPERPTEWSIDLVKSQ